MRARVLIIIAVLVLISNFAFSYSKRNVFFYENEIEDNSSIFYAKGSKNIKKISLTFDDGPGYSTEAVLKILKDKKVKATFFLLGSQVEIFPDLARKIANDGHEIANHTYGHLNFHAYAASLRSSIIEEELIKSDKILSSIIGVKPHFVRYPHGYANDDALFVAKKHKYKVVNWSFGEDWLKKIKKETMIKNYSNGVANGAILLFHDAPQNAKCLSFLPKLIDNIKKRGFEIVTVGELLSLKQ